MNFDYKKEQNKLEKIISEMQNGELSIDETLDKYKEAEGTIQQMEKYLKSVQNKITKIKSK